jgi:hypothetical protein
MNEKQSFMLSWSGQLTWQEILWSVFKISLVGAVLIMSAIWFSAHMLNAEKIREQNGANLMYSSDR